MRTETLHSTKAWAQVYRHTVSDPPTLEDLSFALYHMLTPPEQFAVRLRTPQKNFYYWFDTLSLHDLRRIYVAWSRRQPDKLDKNIHVSCVKTFESILWGNRPVISTAPTV